MAISAPFEIALSKADDRNLDLGDPTEMMCAIEKALLPIVNNCFDGEPNLAPMTADDDFGPGEGKNSKYAKRIVYAIQKMSVAQSRFFINIFSSQKPYAGVTIPILTRM